MKCEACGTELSLSYETRGPNRYHSAERCRNALKAQLDEARQALVEQREYTRAIENLMQAAEKRAAEAEQERDTIETTHLAFAQAAETKLAAATAKLAEAERERDEAERAKEHWFESYRDESLNAGRYSARAERLRAAIEMYVDAATDDQGTTEERERYRAAAFANLQGALAQSADAPETKEGP